MKTKGLALLASIALSLGLLELALRIFYEVPPDWTPPQILHLRSPLLGWVLPPDVDAYTIDAPVHTNSLGLRDDRIEPAKPPGETRVLALGDSFTFALGVRFEDLWVQRLERKLSEARPQTRYQVINAGVAGYNTRQELIYLEAEGLRLDPDLIVVAFYWNDLLDNEAPLPDLERTPLRDPEDRYYDREPDHALPYWIRSRLRRSLVLYLSVTRAKDLWAALQPDPRDFVRVQRALLAGDQAQLEPLWRTTGQRLLEIHRAAREQGIPVILLAFPMENQLRHDFPKMVFVQRLREIWEPTGMPFVDVEPAYRQALAEGVNPFLPYDQHPSAAGMEIAAQLVYDAIAERGFLNQQDRVADGH